MPSPRARGGAAPSRPSCRSEVPGGLRTHWLGPRHRETIGTIVRKCGGWREDSPERGAAELPDAERCRGDGPTMRQTMRSATGRHWKVSRVLAGEPVSHPDVRGVPPEGPCQPDAPIWIFPRILTALVDWVGCGGTRRLSARHDHGYSYRKTGASLAKPGWAISARGALSAEGSEFSPSVYRTPGLRVGIGKVARGHTHETI